MWYIEEQEKVFLDYNATTPLDSEVAQAITDGLKYWGNPSSCNPLGKKAKELIEVGRADLAELFHVTPREVFFTSGGTETNHWIIHNAIEYYKAQHGREGKPHMICSAVEHPSILEPLEDLQKKNLIELTEVGIDVSSGCIRLGEIEAAICENTCLITVMLCNNETGVIQPLRDIAAIARKAQNRYDNRILIHTDAAQAVGKIDVNLDDLKVDLVTVVGHKFYGPRIGALVLRSAQTVPLNALFLGGGQESNKRSGTENTPMIIGLGKAARVTLNSLAAHIEHMKDTRDYFERRLKEVFKDGVTIHFATSERMPNTSSVAFIKYENSADELLAKCSSFIASTGAACHAGSKKISKVLSACGISDEVAMKTVRFSLGRQTSRDDIDRVMSELSSIIFLSKYGTSLLGAFSKGPIPGF